MPAQDRRSRFSGSFVTVFNCGNRISPPVCIFSKLRTWTQAACPLASDALNVNKPALSFEKQLLPLVWNMEVTDEKTLAGPMGVRILGETKHTLVNSPV